MTKRQAHDYGLESLLTMDGVVFVIEHGITSTRCLRFLSISLKARKSCWSIFGMTYMSYFLR